MAKKAIIIVLSLVFTASCVVYVPRTPEGYPGPEEDYYEEGYPIASPSVDVSYFYDSLSPHGMWIYHPVYLYVWIPYRTGHGWRPYTYGEWIWTDYGWTWISRFEWGWAPFHYGRWSWDRHIGWFWIPDTLWGPAWVAWRWGKLYVGWAPLPPEAVFVSGVGINSMPYTLPGSSWVFVESPNFLRTRIDRYLLPIERNTTIIRRTVLSTNIVVRGDRIINQGIQRDILGRSIKTRISKHELRSTSRPEKTIVRKDKVEIFRPTVQKSEETKPEKVFDRNDVQREKMRKRQDEQEDILVLDEKEQNLKELHERERYLLEKTQQKEAREEDERLMKIRRSDQSPSEKKQVEKKHKEEMDKLKETHKKEKIQLQERQKKEEEEIKKKRTSKKETP